MKQINTTAQFHRVVFDNQSIGPLQKGASYFEEATSDPDSVSHGTCMAMCSTMREHLGFEI
jgi:hypothetical protein